MIRTELHFRLPNSPGALASALTALDAERIRVLALSVERNGDARVLVDNLEHAYATLTARHMRVEKREAIVTAVAARSLATLLTSVAAAGVNIEYCYMSSMDQDGTVTAVLGVDDAVRAAATAGI